MRHKWPKKMEMAKIYFSIIFYDFKYVFDTQLLITSYNILRESHFLLFKKKDALKYFYFLAKKRWFVILSELLGAAVCL